MPTASSPMQGRRQPSPLPGVYEAPLGGCRLSGGARASWHTVDGEVALLTKLPVPAAADAVRGSTSPAEELAYITRHSGAVAVICQDSAALEKLLPALARLDAERTAGGAGAGASAASANGASGNGAASGDAAPAVLPANDQAPVWAVKEAGSWVSCAGSALWDGAPGMGTDECGLVPSVIAYY